MDTISHQDTSNKRNDLKSKLEKEFQKIYSDYYKLLFYISFRIVGSKADAEDAVNETFLNLFNNYYNVRNIKYYLITSIKNTSYNILHKRKYNAEVSFDENMLDIEDRNQQDKINEFFFELRKVLNEEEINIIIDHLIYNLSFSEIANSLKVSRFSIAGKYRRALEKMKKYYKEGL